MTPEPHQRRGDTPRWLRLSVLSCSASIAVGWTLGDYSWEGRGLGPLALLRTLDPEAALVFCLPLVVALTASVALFRLRAARLAVSLLVPGMLMHSVEAARYALPRHGIRAPLTYEPGQVTYGEYRFAWEAIPLALMCLGVLCSSGQSLRRNRFGVCVTGLVLLFLAAVPVNQRGGWVSDLLRPEYWQEFRVTSTARLIVICVGLVAAIVGVVRREKWLRFARRFTALALLLIVVAAPVVFHKIAVHELIAFGSPGSVPYESTARTFLLGYGRLGLLAIGLAVLLAGHTRPNEDALVRTFE